MQAMEWKLYAPCCSCLMRPHCHRLWGPIISSSISWCSSPFPSAWSTNHEYQQWFLDHICGGLLVHLASAPSTYNLWWIKVCCFSKNSRHHWLVLQRQLLSLYTISCVFQCQPWLWLWQLGKMCSCHGLTSSPSALLGIPKGGHDGSRGGQGSS